MIANPEPDTLTQVTTGCGYGPVSLSVDLTDDGILASRDDQHLVVVMAYAPNAGELVDDANHMAINALADRWSVDAYSYSVANWASPIRYVCIDLSSHPDALELASEILTEFYEYGYVEGSEDILSELEFEDHETSLTEGWHDTPCDRCGDN